MEDFLQLIVKCFPMATFILVAASCTNKPKEPYRTSGRKLTMSTSSMTSEEEEQHDVKNENKTEEVTEEKEEDKSLNEDERKVACGNKKDPKEKSEETPENNKKKEENKGEQEIILDETNPHFFFLLGGENRDLQQSVFHTRISIEQTNAFQWTMKKRLSFDEGCWKQLSRRISAIRAEGFDCRVNTRRAKENKQTADRETKLDIIFAKWAAGKPKKKGGE